MKKYDSLISDIGIENKKANYVSVFFYILFNVLALAMIALGVMAYIF